jgi:hypothetical protein
MEANMSRKQSRVDCDIILNKTEDGTVSICRATNISLGGMRLQRLLEPFEPEQRNVTIEVELPGSDEPLTIGASKVYDSEGYLGVKFTDISHRHFVRLRSWLQDQTLSTSLPKFETA